MHDSRVHEWEMGSEVAGWAGVKGVQGESMVTGLVNEGNGLKIKHKMHADKLIFNKKYTKSFQCSHSAIKIEYRYTQKNNQTI